MVLAILQAFAGLYFCAAVGFALGTSALPRD
jgi:hypothetical protein